VLKNWSAIGSVESDVLLRRAVLKGVVGRQALTDDVALLRRAVLKGVVGLSKASGVCCLLSANRN
jgi:hypothetical protein